MRCEQVLDRLPDHTLGTLSEEDAAAVRAHLRGCAACRSDAEGLDQGLSMFASAAHADEPPPELQERVLSVLAEEWADRAPEVVRLRRRPAGAWLAAAACLVLLAVALVWGAGAHRTVGRQTAILTSLQSDAKAYRNFLHTLGGNAVRVATLSPSAGSAVTGTAVLYDSDVGQSWVLVLARRPVASGTAFATIASPDGGKPLKLFPIRFNGRGEGSTWLVTSADISRFDHVQLWGSDGSLLADGTAAPDHS